MYYDCVWILLKKFGYSFHLYQHYVQNTDKTTFFLWKDLGYWSSLCLECFSTLANFHPVTLTSGTLFIPVASGLNLVCTLTHLDSVKLG